MPLSMFARKRISSVRKRDLATMGRAGGRSGTGRQVRAFIHRVSVSYQIRSSSPRVRVVGPERAARLPMEGGNRRCFMVEQGIR